MVRIAENARKWGVSDDSMHHALRQPVKRWPQDDDRVVIIGADESGQLLELVIEGEDDDTEDDSLPVIVHAMPLRRAWQRYL